jgi:trans-aconitate methyltransferase
MSEYNWNAEEYEQHSQAQTKWARELLEKLDLEGSEDVLDVGRGDGRITAEIARLVLDGSVVGIDSSNSMIELKARKEWQQYFDNFEFPYGFLGTEEYENLLLASGFTINRIELIPKDMVHAGKSSFEGWIRTTWLPYTERVPEERKNIFIGQISKEYIKRVPLDAGGKVHVAMVRLEVEAEKIP